MVAHVSYLAPPPDERTLVQRIDFESLDPQVQRAVEQRTGAIRASRVVGVWPSGPVTAFLYTETGPVFFKAVPADSPAAAHQRCEAVINPHVRPISARLRWHETVMGWSLLAFDAVAGARKAAYVAAPDGDELFDLPKLMTAMEILAQIPCPDLPGIDPVEQRWAGYLDDPADAKHFAGHTLLHTDYNRLNILITKAKASIVDWGRPAKGAAFIDSACLVLRLIAAGHSPDTAEEWAAQTSAWCDADPHALDLFAVANVRLWREIAAQEPRAARTVQMAAAAAAWTGHRLSAS